MSAKLAIKVLTIFTAFALVSPDLFAASSTSGTLPITMGVTGSLSLTVVLKKNDYAGAEIVQMDFGTLKDIGTGSLRSSKTGTTGTGAVAAFIYIASFDPLPYTVKQSGTPLASLSSSLPNGACTVVPVYVVADQPGQEVMPPGAYVGQKGTFVETDKILYYSGPDGLSREITAYYSITDDPAAGATTGVPLNQAGGMYQGTVIFTVTQ